MDLINYEFVYKYMVVSKISSFFDVNLCSAFFNSAIENNDDYEDKANYYLCLLRVLISGFARGSYQGRKVVLIEQQYLQKEETSFWCPPREGFLKIPAAIVIFIASTIMGVCLKLFAWIRNPSLIQKTLDYVEWRKEKFRDFREIQSESPLYKKLKNTRAIFDPKDTFSNLSDEMKMEIYRFLDVKDILALRKTSRHHYVFSKKTLPLVKEKEAMLRKYFSEILSSNEWMIEKLKIAPRMKLPATFFDSSSQVEQLQRVDDCVLKKDLDFVKPSDVGNNSYGWGYDPFPFIAIRLCTRPLGRGNEVKENVIILYRLGKKGFQWRFGEGDSYSVDGNKMEQIRHLMINKTLKGSSEMKLWPPTEPY